MKDFETGGAPLPPPLSPWNLAVQHGWSRRSTEPAGRPWVSPGPPPGTAQRTPGWAIALIVVGVALTVLCGGGVVLSLAAGEPTTVGGTSVSPTASKAPERAVVVSGTCDKKIIGEYGLIASITVENQTTALAVGRVWVRWQMTGSEPMVRSKNVTLTPGQRVSLHVDEQIEAKDWYWVDKCDYGWTADKPTG